MPLKNYIYLSLILILSAPIFLMAENFFNIINTSDNSIQIHFELPSWSMERNEANNLSSVKIDDVPYLFLEETETLPVFSTMIAIPCQGGVSIQINSTQQNIQNQIKLNFDSLLSSEKANGRYNEELYPASSVVISEPQIMRDFRIVTLNIYPFQYDQSKQVLFISEFIDIQLIYDNQPSINEIDPPLNLSPAFANIYPALILNYEQFITRDEITYSRPRMLVIYGNYSETTYQTQVNNYITWKKQKGYLINAVSTAITGTNTNSIKNYIQSQYDNPNTRPDYIVLIGDTSGNMSIPSYSSYIDYYYTWLAGNDNLGDAAIGRISVETTADMVNYMAKVYALEQDINISNASWLNRMVLVGDSGSSGISTIYTNRYIHDHSLMINPSYTYTEVYGTSPSSTTINNAINQGVVFYNYRGYIGMSGWPSTINQLNNGYKLFHSVFITCNTGTFNSGTSTTEAVVRFGTAATLGGAITSIGMATSSTHTPMNNCLDVGIFHSIYPLGMRNMSEALLYAKLYLYAVYGVSHPTQANNFAGYCNLIGDPTAAVYVGIPSTFTCNAPTSIAAGTSNLEITVLNNSNQIVSGASVVLSNANGQQALAFTNAQGKAYLEFASNLSGSLTLTINKDDFKPLVSTINIASTGGIVYNNVEINDNIGGNGNGLIDAGEPIDLFVFLKNTSTQVLNPSGNAYCSDPYITLINADRIEYNNINPQAIGANIEPIIIQIAPDCPDQHQFSLKFVAETTAGSWEVFIPFTVHNGNLNITSYTFIGAPNNCISPGDNLPMSINLSNVGSLALNGINARLRSYDTYFVVLDSTGTYASIPVGSAVANNSDTFSVFARSTCIDGMVIPLELYLYNSVGYKETIYFTVTIGQTTVHDPLGQDAYGYFIFDQGDTGYTQCPTYNWIGIAPAEGGNGILLALTDPGNSSDEGDQTSAVAITTVNLPFPFKFYGIEYSRASICSNGFIAFGQTQDADWRNWRIPDAGGPSPMVAVFWDDLTLGTGSGVYTYYNSTSHYYVVEWYHLISGYNNSSLETFEAILYDPVYYPTATGDGQIKLQYQQFNNIDIGSGDTFPHGNYCTIGIEDHTETIGLEYTFNNTYPTAAAALSNNSALFITTRPILPDFPYIVLEQVSVIDPNDNHYLEPGENADLSIRLGNRGLVDASGVSAVITCSDSYVTILNSSANYGTIPAQSSVYPQTNYSLFISPDCPAHHLIIFTINITSDTSNWTYNFQLEVVIPELGFNNMTINDSGGNSNGILDPGETVTVNIHIVNIGLIPTPPGTATLSCNNSGITIINGSNSFPVLAVGAFEPLSYTISSASSISSGTLINLIFNAVAGTTTAQHTEIVEVGAPIPITIGTGTGTQSYPLDRYYNYCAHEAIYLANEVGTACTIKNLAYYKASGTDVSPIQPVTIYMKNTTASSLSSGNYSTSGYTQVYSGSFPNDSNPGWMEVTLSPMFVYDGVSNLSILIVKGYQQWISNYPMWTYTSTGTTRARQNRSDSSAPTNLSSTNNLPNLRLKIFPQVQSLLPPQNFTAIPSHQSVYLSWSAPVSGNPTAYKIFRNSVSIANVTTLNYTDFSVTDGVSYSYYIIAVYSNGESSPTPTLTVIPNTYPPTNLTAIAGNAMVSLSWNSAEGRSSSGDNTKERLISSYRVYRNGSAIQDVTENTYQDTGLVNGITYSYYVTTIYTNPAGESAPSNTVEATPVMVSTVVLGTGTSVSTGAQNSPLNICNNSVHGQSVYTAAELNAAGLVGPLRITALGFYVVTTPALPLPQFVVRMKHTTATDASNWHTAENLLTTYSNPSYMPIAGGFDMMTFNTPFEWNGTDNILVDTAFSLVETASNTGTLQYTPITNGYRFTWDNTVDQTNIFTGGMVVARRYNIQIYLQPILHAPDITVFPLSLNFGEIEVGTSAIQNFTIQNNGDVNLTGTITTPPEYSISPSDIRSSIASSTKKITNLERNTIDFNISPGNSSIFNITFAPPAVGIYNGEVEIASNDPEESLINISVSGAGFIYNLIQPVVNISLITEGTVISWQSVPYATSYQIWTSDDPYGTYTILQTITEISYLDTRNLSKVFYKVIAIRN